MPTLAIFGFLDYYFNRIFLANTLYLLASQTFFINYFLTVNIAIKTRFTNVKLYFLHENSPQKPLPIFHLNYLTFSNKIQIILDGNILANLPFLLSKTNRFFDFEPTKKRVDNYIYNYRLFVFYLLYSNYMRSGTSIPSKLKAALITSATFCESCTLNTFLVKSTSPNMCTD